MKISLKKKIWIEHFEEIDKDDDGKLNPSDFTKFMANRVLQPNGTTILEGLSQVAPEANITYNPNAKKLPNEGFVLAVIGEYPYAEGYGDDGDLQLNKADLEILKRAYSSNNKVVVVLISGRPIMLGDHIDNLDALMASFLPGMAGEGIADVIFGEFNPQAKLNFNWPLAVDGTELLFELGSGLNYN